MKNNSQRPSALGALFLLVTGLSAKLKPVLWGWWYNQLARRDINGELLFMNYGYSDPETDLKLLDQHDEPYRQPIQLYENVIKSLNIKDKYITEVGCGRGGGATWLARKHQPAIYTGVDLSKAAISWCRNTHRLPNVEWVQGKASDLPLATGSQDVVINVESSHCYPDMSAFLAEVYRVLKPEGHFAFCDLRDTSSLDELDKQLRSSGLKIVHRIDITDNVLAALDEMSERRSTGINRIVPGLFRKAFRDFAGIKDTAIYSQFKSRKMTYIQYLCEK